VSGIVVWRPGDGEVDGVAGPRAQQRRDHLRLRAAHVAALHVDDPVADGEPGPLTLAAVPYPSHPDRPRAAHSHAQPPRAVPQHHRHPPLIAASAFLVVGKYDDLYVTTNRSTTNNKLI